MRLSPLFIIILLFSSAHALAKNNPSSKTHIKSLEVLSKPSEGLSFSDIIDLDTSERFFKNKRKNEFRVGGNSPINWLLLKFNDNFDSSQNYVLEIDRPTLDKVTVFLPNSRGEWDNFEAGDTINFDQRPISHRNLLFDISGAEPPDKLYIKVENRGSAIFSIHTFEKNSYLKTDNERVILYSFYYGLLIALVIFNFLIYLSVRDISYLWYVAYLSFMTLFIVIYEGFAFQYLWPNQPELANKAMYVALFLLMSFGMGFSRNMLNLSEVDPKLATVLNWVSLIILAALLVGLFLGNTFLSRTTHVLALSGFSLLIYTIYKSIQAGYKPAIYAAFSFVFLLAGGISNIFGVIGLIPKGFISTYGLQIGVVFEAFILSFALAYRINYTNEQLRLSKQKISDSKKEFATKLITFQDNEKKQTAANLHDSIGQRLLVIKMQLSQLFEKNVDRENKQKAKGIINLLQESITDVRYISHNLHPHQLERLTLEEALEDLIKQSFKFSSMQVSSDLNNLGQIKEKNAKLHLYRVIQESIKNILTHSNASNVSFESEMMRDNIIIRIIDDGESVHHDWLINNDLSKAFGLSNIQERIHSLKGTVDFRSEANIGFKTIITLPI